MKVRALRNMDEGGAARAHSRAESLARRPRCGGLDSARRAAGVILRRALLAGRQLSSFALAVRAVVPSGWCSSRPAAVSGMRRPPHGVALREAPHSAIDAPSAVGENVQALQLRHTGRRPNGLRGASRSARQAVGIPLAQVRLARWAQSEGTAPEFSTLPARQLRACRERRWLNDAHRDARGVEVPAARSGARDAVAEADQRLTDGRTREETT
jgi:hypothetical protein